MATVIVCTYVEAWCVGCGILTRTHREYLTCSCGARTAKKAEFIESVRLDITANEPF